MRARTKKIFSTQPQSSSIYSITIEINHNQTVKTVFILDASINEIFQEKILKLNPEIHLNLLTRTQDEQLFVTYAWQIDNNNFIAMINGLIDVLKESFFISIDFANQIYQKLPALIQEVETFSLNKTTSTTSTTNSQMQSNHLNCNAKISNETWSTQINVVMNPDNYYLLGNDKLAILSESEARAIIKPYDHGSFVLFKKNQSYHLLVKLNSEIHQFDIFIKNNHKWRLPIKLFFDSSKSFFNLKNEEENLLFSDDGILASSLENFLNLYVYASQRCLRKKIIRERVYTIRLIHYKNVMVKKSAKKSI